MSSESSFTFDLPRVKGPRQRRAQHVSSARDDNERLLTTGERNNGGNNGDDDDGRDWRPWVVCLCVVAAIVCVGVLLLLVFSIFTFSAVPAPTPSPTPQPPTNMPTIAPSLAPTPAPPTDPPTPTPVPTLPFRKRKRLFDVIKPVENATAKLKVTPRILTPPKVDKSQMGPPKPHHRRGEQAPPNRRKPNLPQRLATAKGGGV